MTGRLTATTINIGGQAEIQAPRIDEDLFLYVTDGAGQATYEDKTVQLGQYDVILATPDLQEALIQSDAGGLEYLSFYLPRFIV